MKNSKAKKTFIDQKKKSKASFNSTKFYQKVTKKIYIIILIK